MTLGGAFLFLANTENLKGRLVHFFSVFGRVPFFFYIIHLYLIHLLALIVAEFTGFGWQKMILPAFPSKVEELKGFGFNPLIFSSSFGSRLLVSRARTFLRVPYL